MTVKRASERVRRPAPSLCHVPRVRGAEPSQVFLGSKHPGLLVGSVFSFSCYPDYCCQDDVWRAICHNASHGRDAGGRRPGEAGPRSGQSEPGLRRPGGLRDRPAQTGQVLRRVSGAATSVTGTWGLRPGWKIQGRELGRVFCRLHTRGPLTY